jgi:rubrerythrin
MDIRNMSKEKIRDTIDQLLAEEERKSQEFLGSVMDREMPRHEWQNHDLPSGAELAEAARRASAPSREIESMTADEHDDTAEWLVNYDNNRTPVHMSAVDEQTIRLARAQVHALLGISKHLNEITSLLHDTKTELKED